MKLKGYRLTTLFTVSLSILLLLVNLWQYYNPQIETEYVDKIVKVEVPIEPIHIFEQFHIKSGRLTIQFGDGDTSAEYYEFVRGEFLFTNVHFIGEWDTATPFRFCEIGNCTFNLTDIDVILENCTVENSYFEGTFNSAVYLRDTSFGGLTTFDIGVVNGTGNTGLENVIFEGRVVQE